MATSGVTTGTLTVRQVVTTAARMLGAVPLGEDLQAEEAAEAITQLNWMLKSWQADGITNSWRVEEVAYTHPADTATVTLDTNYLDLTNARRRASNFDTPLVRYSVNEYAAIPNKAQSGTPIVYSIRKTQSTLAVTLWPVPSSDTAIYADGARVIDDVTSLNETLDVPQEWLETVFTCLAARLILPFRTIITDQATAAEVKERAASLYERLKSFDQTDASAMFQPQPYG